MDRTQNNALLARPTSMNVGRILVSKTTLACQLDVSPRTLDRWVADGKFPAPCHRGGKSGGATRFLVKDVDDWIVNSLAATPAAIA